MKHIIPVITILLSIFITVVITVDYLDSSLDKFNNSIKKSVTDSYFTGCHTALTYSGFTQDDAVSACKQMTDEYKLGLEAYIGKD